MDELHKKLVKIQQELNAPKAQFNAFSKFYYRSCEDILEAVKPLLRDGNLTLTANDEVVEIGTRFYIKATYSLSDGTNTITAHAYAREAETKTGMDLSQITGATSSYARKYALNGLFAIDDSKDSDTQDNRVVARNRPTVQPKYINTKPDAERAATLAKIRAQKIEQPKVKTIAEPKTPAQVLDGKLPADDEVIQVYTSPEGAVLRDDKGHTACVNCGRVVGKPVEQFSTKKYGKVLCMACQAKEGR